MKTIGYSIITLLYLVGSISNAAEKKVKAPDLSTPKRALYTFLKASREGDADTCLLALSEDSRNLLVSGAKQFGEDIQEAIQDDPFAKIEVVGSIQTKKRAAIQIKARYKTAWFTMDGMNVPELSEDDRADLEEESISHSNNVGYHVPCAVKGVGYVAYLLVKEGSAWKVQKGHGLPIKVDLKKFMKE